MFFKNFGTTMGTLIKKTLSGMLNAFLYFLASPLLLPLEILAFIIALPLYLYRKAASEMEGVSVFDTVVVAGSMTMFATPALLAIRLTSYLLYLPMSWAIELAFVMYESYRDGFKNGITQGMIHFGKGILLTFKHFFQHEIPENILTKGFAPWFLMEKNRQNIKIETDLLTLKGKSLPNSNDFINLTEDEISQAKSLTEQDQELRVYLNSYEQLVEHFKAVNEVLFNPAPDSEVCDAIPDSDVCDVLLIPITAPLVIFVKEYYDETAKQWFAIPLQTHLLNQTSLTSWLNAWQTAHTENENIKLKHFMTQDKIFTPDIYKNQKTRYQYYDYNPDVTPHVLYETAAKIRQILQEKTNLISKTDTASAAPQEETSAAAATIDTPTRSPTPLTQNQHSFWAQPSDNVSSDDELLEETPTTPLCN